MDDELVDAYQAQLWIVQGKNQLVARWVEDTELEKRIMAKVDQPRFDPVWEIHSQTMARVYISRGKYDQALHMIEPLLKRARADQRMRSMLKVLAMRAVIYRLKGDSQEALQILERALNHGKVEGYVRTFLDEGEVMVQLLYEAAARGIHPEYTGELLAAYASSRPASFSIKEKQRDQKELVEPLSEREIEVLSLIAQGLSNQEIASRLHISLSTVKGHTSNIYGKLGVHKRTQAVARGKVLGVLPRD
jgi:LuxR family maltose regulon positive regulatory protein